MRVISFMLTTTYGLSVSSMPTCAMWLPSGPIENGTTYIVRPRMQPANSRRIVARISAGATQLLVGPASSSRSLQMNVRSSTRATSLGIGKGEIGIGPQRRVEPTQRSARDHLGAQPVVLGLAAVAPDDAIRRGERGGLANPRAKAANAERTKARRRRKWDRSGS